MMLVIAFAGVIVSVIVFSIFNVYLDRKRWAEWQQRMAEFSLDPDNPKWVKDDVETDDTLPF